MPKETFFNLPEEKRRRITDLAVREFAAHSYSKASLSNIVARAGIAKGSMYQYFADKKDLYLYLVELATEEKISHIQRSVDPEADFFTALAQAIWAGINFDAENPWLSHLLARSLEPTAGFFQELSVRGARRTVDYFEEMLTTAQAQGTVKKSIAPRVGAYLLTGVLSGGLTEYIVELLGISVEELLNNPEHNRQLSQAQIGHIVEQAICFIRSGLGGQSRL